MTDPLTEVLVRLAMGGTGLIITGHTFVNAEGRALARQLGVHEDRLIPGLGRMVDAVHAVGGRIALQLAHAGLWAAVHLTGLEALGPSVAETEKGPLGRAMTAREIREASLAFARGAARARAAGFDAVQLHGAHGYLIHQFLSPRVNRRTDGYGGEVENRARFVLEVVEAIRAEAGPDFPLFIKLNSEDFLPGGFSVEDMLRVSTMLERAGVDCIEMSGGTFLSGSNVPSRKGRTRPGEPEAYYEAAAKRYKERIATPLALVGGIRNIETAEGLVGNGVTDLISLCRPLIREPDLVNRWRSGERRPARCVSDNGCFKPGFEGRGVHCVVEALENH